MNERTVYPQRVALPDHRGRRRDVGLAREWVPLAVGTPSRTREVFGTHTFVAYAPGGVPIPGTAGADDVLMAPWTDGAGTVYLFQWNPSTDLMMVTLWNGEELDPGFDLSAVVDHPFRATFANSPVTRIGQRLSGNGRILAVLFDVTTALDADDTDFWTLTAYLRRVDAPSPQTTGVPLGSFDSSRVNWTAYEDFPIYEDEVGTIFHDSDRLLIEASVSGDPAELVGCSAWGLIKREVF